jgi:hypothetical protein
MCRTVVFLTPVGWHSTTGRDEFHVIWPLLDSEDDTTIPNECLCCVDVEAAWERLGVKWRDDFGDFLALTPVMMYPHEITQKALLVTKGRAD